MKRLLILIFSLPFLVACAPSGSTSAIGLSSTPISENKTIVREVQTLLNASGYPVGTPDGVAGTRTRSQISSYETANRLPADGKIDDALLATLRGKASSATPTLKANDRDAPAGEGMLGVRIESGNAAGVTLHRIFFSNDANNLRVADQHCAKFKKVAQFEARENDRRRYRCVAA